MSCLWGMEREGRCGWSICPFPLRFSEIQRLDAKAMIGKTVSNAMNVLRG